MKWISKINLKNEETKRQKIKFAFLPTKVKEYTVWLEFFLVTEELQKIKIFDHILEEWITGLKWIEINREII